MKKDISIMNFSETIIKSISPYKINKIAKQTGFTKRKPIKITPLKFLTTLCFGLISKKNMSLTQLAGFIGVSEWSENKIPSKQGLFKRLSSNSTLFMQAILETILHDATKKPNRVKKNIFERFNKVFIQDSTCIKINDNLEKYYPGSKGAHKSNANIRIQLIWEYFSGKIKGMNLSPFTENDQSHSSSILAFIGQGDLIIRDLGFYSLEVFEKIIFRKAYFLSRFLDKTKVLHQINKKEIELVKKLKNTKSNLLEIPVLLGIQNKISCRLIAVRLPDKIVNERRRKARIKSKKRGSQVDQKHLALLAWNIFITNIPEEIWSAEVVPQAYILRWQIELIFKTWKSYFSLDHLETGSKAMLETFIYAKLIGITLIYRFVSYIEEYSLKTAAKQLSFMKVLKLISTRLTDLIQKIFCTKDLIGFLEGIAFALLRLCLVESRTRKTTYEKLLPTNV